MAFIKSSSLLNPRLSDCQHPSTINSRAALPALPQKTVSALIGGECNLTSPPISLAQVQVGPHLPFQLHLTWRSASPSLHQQTTKHCAPTQQGGERSAAHHLAVASKWMQFSSDIFFPTTGFGDKSFVFFVLASHPQPDARFPRNRQSSHLPTRLDSSPFNFAEPIFDATPNRRPINQTEYSCDGQRPKIDFPANATRKPVRSTIIRISPFKSLDIEHSHYPADPRPVD